MPEPISDDRAKIAELERLLAEEQRLRRKVGRIAAAAVALSLLTGTAVTWLLAQRYEDQKSELIRRNDELREQNRRLEFERELDRVLDTIRDAVQRPPE